VLEPADVATTVDSQVIWRALAQPQLVQDLFQALVGVLVLLVEALVEDLFPAVVLPVVLVLLLATSAVDQTTLPETVRTP
jgi:hypothetical protein